MAFRLLQAAADRARFEALKFVRYVALQVYVQSTMGNRYGEKVELPITQELVVECGLHMRAKWGRVCC